MRALPASCPCGLDDTLPRAANSSRLVKWPESEHAEDTLEHVALQKERLLRSRTRWSRALEAGQKFDLVCHLPFYPVDARTTGGDVQLFLMALRLEQLFGLPLRLPFVLCLGAAIGQRNREAIGHTP